MTTNNILVLTSTIAPQSGVHALARANPEDRLADYLKALDFYLPLLAAGIFHRAAYIDNSGHSLDAIAEKAEALGVADRLELVSYASDIPPNYSRYYLEANLLLEGFRRSKTLAEAGDSALWKVTGRYIVKNLARIIATQPDNFDLYLNLRNLPYRVVDFYLIGAKPSALKALLSYELESYRSKEDGEVLLRQKIDSGAFDQLKISPRMRATPQLSGVRGFDSAVYDSPQNALKHKLRSAANMIAPWLWI
ncbi:MAG: hypothetical protein AAGD92_10660 [Pseudomonadota bacterium]